jgi:hypothetical protein
VSIPKICAVLLLIGLILILYVHATLGLVVGIREPGSEASGCSLGVDGNGLDVDNMLVAVPSEGVWKGFPSAIDLKVAA